MNTKKIIIILTTILLSALIFYLFLGNININRLNASISYSSTADRIHFLNAGTADCILIESQGEFAIVDGGTYEIGQKVSAKDGYLRKIMGDRKLKYIIATHNHSDHTGGLYTIARDFADSNTQFYYGVLRNEKTGAVLTPSSTIRIKDIINVLNEKLTDGQTTSNIHQLINNNLIGSNALEVGNFEIEILNTENDTKNIDVPGMGSYAYYGDLNRDSIIELVTHRPSGKKTLLTGDMEVDDEYRFLCTDSTQCRKYNGQNIIDYIGEIDIYKMGHHGSYTSNSIAFLNRLNPENVIVSRGGSLVLNDTPYNAMDTYTYLVKKGIPIYMTAFNLTDGYAINSNYDNLVKNTNKEAIVAIFNSSDYDIVSSGYSISNAKINGRFVNQNDSSYGSNWEKWEIDGSLAWIYKPTNNAMKKEGWIGDSYIVSRNVNPIITRWYAPSSELGYIYWLEKGQAYYQNFVAKNVGTNANTTYIIDSSSGRLKNFTGWLLNYAQNYIYVKQDNSGYSKLQTGWLDEGSETNKYYLYPKYVKEDYYKYYEIGDMVTGWNIIDNKIYYFDSTGAKQKGTKTISNKQYTFDSTNGYLTNATVNIGNYNYYCNSTGVCKIEVEIPTAQEYCKNLTYNGEYQTLVYAEEPGYYWSNYYKKNVNSYSVSATLYTSDNYGYYIWSDHTTGQKSITCSIKSDTTPTATIPTSSEYCNTLTYTGNSQTLVKTAGDGYTWTSGTTRTEAGSQTVTATLNSGYKWSDNTTGTKTINCIIEKATPTIMLSAAYTEVDVGSTITFNEKADVKGKFTVTSNNTTIATVTQASSNEIEANTNNKVTVTAKKAGTASITINFTPADTTNYNNAKSITYEVIVNSGTANTYTVTYDCGSGASGTPSAQTVTNGNQFATSSMSCEKVGYTQVRWTTNSNGTNDNYGWTGWSGTWTYSNGSYGISNNSVKLYAGYTANTYTCAAGKYLRASDATCQTCPANSYCPGITNATYTGSDLGKSSCPANYTTSASGSDAANDCYLKTTAKKYVATANAAEVDCAAGGYCPGNVTVYYGSTGGRTNCPANSYCTAGVSAATACTTLGSNYTTSSAGSDAANDCYIPKASLSKKYVASANSNTLTNCEAGYYCPGTTDVHYGSTGGRVQCTAGNFCTAGVSTQTACSTLGTGYTSAAGADANTKCYISVAAGSYKNSLTGTTTAGCGAGKYSTAHNGYYNVTDNACTNISAGCFGTSATTACPTKCAQGSYSAAGASSCTACAAGKTNSGTGNTSACTTACSQTNVSTWNIPSWSNNSVSNLCSVKTCSSGYEVSSNACVENLDTEKPTVSISGGTTQKASSQTLTLKCSDNKGVSAYYFGTTNPTSIGAITTTTASDLTSLQGNGLSKTGITNGTYYLGCRDSSGNWDKTSIVIRKYVVNNLFETIAGQSGTYTSSNYTSSLIGTYYIKSGTAITLASVYTKPTGGETFKGYSTSYSASAVNLSTTNPTVSNDTTTYYMWFDRNTYTVTVSSGSNGSTKIETVTKTGNSVTATSGSTKTLTVKYGDKVKATATPSIGYSLSEWTGGYISGNTNPVTGSTVSSAKTITSSFSANKYKVTFDCNGGTGQINEQQATYGNQFTLTSSVCFKEGYSQTSWNEKADGTGTQWDIGQNWKKWGTYNQDDYAHDVKLYAQYTKEEEQDTESPTVSISGGTTQKASSQTLTLKCSDNVGVTAYYFGTTQPTSIGSITTTTSSDLTNLQGNGLNKAEITNGTYYLGCRDAAGKWSKTSIVIRKYVVNNLLETIIGQTGTYTNANYVSASTNTYYIKNGTSITLTNAYNVPTGATSTTFKGYSTSYAESAVSLSTANPTVANNDTTTYYMWFNRNTYTVTLSKPANGSITAQTVTQSNNSVTATSAATTLTVKYGDKVKVTATPNTGYGFSSWSGEYVSGSTNPITGSAITANKTITSTFVSNTLTFNGATLASGTYGNSYTSGAFTGASNGTGTYTYTIKSGAPEGATINSSTRKITFTNTTPAGNYNVVVTATDTNSKATKDATMKITINKATPTITLSSTTASVVSGKTLTFNEKANVKGKFTLTSNNTNIATVSQASSNEIEANTNNKVTVTGVSSGSAVITVNFIPTDTNNYNNASSKTYTANITKSAQVPTSNEYCKSLTYTGSSQTLVKTAGEGYTWTSGTTKTYVGDQAVTATLSSGYRWSDNTTENKTINCSINKKDVTIIAKAQTITYGTSVSSTTNDVTSSGLVSNDILDSIVLTQNEINVGTTGKVVPNNAVIKNDDNDVTNNYNITYTSGNLTINKKSITITAKAQTIKEDSEILKDIGKVTVKTLSNNDKLTNITLQEDRDNNKIIPSNAVIKRSNEDVTNNYNITYKNGNLSVEIDTVTLTLSTNNTNYGTPQEDKIIVKKGSTYEVNEGKLIIKTSGEIIDEVDVILNNINGYMTTFTGWDSSNGTLNEDKEIKANFKIEAIKYTIKYNLDGGSLSKSNPDNYTIESETFTLNNPSKDGYIFKGWTGSNGTTPQTSVSINKGTIGNKTYNAIFEKEPEPVYTITYNLNGGEETVTNPREYTKISNDITLSNVQRDGYIFIGWIGSNGNEPQLNVTIKKGSTGNKTYTAVFKRDISDLDIKLDKNEYEYTGNYIKPIVTIKDNTYTLIENTDYEIEYSNNKEIGEGIITISGIGEYTRGKVLSFTIVGKADISKITIEDNKYALIDEKTSLNELKSLIETNNVILKDKNGNIKTNTSLIGTQDKIEIEGKIYNVVVKGDITGNGKIEFNDVIKAYRFYRKKLTPNELELKASDVVSDNKVKFNDIIKIYRMYRGK